MSEKKADPTHLPVLVLTLAEAALVARVDVRTIRTATRAHPRTPSYPPHLPSLRHGETGRSVVLVTELETWLRKLSAWSPWPEPSETTESGHASSVSA